MCTFWMHLNQPFQKLFVNVNLLARSRAISENLNFQIFPGERAPGITLDDSPLRDRFSPPPPPPKYSPRPLLQRLAFFLPTFVRSFIHSFILAKRGPKAAFGPLALAKRVYKFVGLRSDIPPAKLHEFSRKIYIFRRMSPRLAPRSFAPNNVAE